MAFTFAAFCYMLALLLTAALIFFAIWHVSTRLDNFRQEPLACRSNGAGGEKWVKERGRLAETGLTLGQLRGYVSGTFFWVLRRSLRVFATSGQNVSKLLHRNGRALNARYTSWDPCVLE